ncbi:hypothetical protein PLESTB_001065800 [Pleodorina starrii]|uniref:Probable quinone oxidoreductase n=1 Tax=Pleodorina starrii TaxID=330485 RepID=A0A9W6F4P3_9CHLO|nr:hypothetical protein PLESTB_001065800 [Pleodorina starrii]
MSLALLGAQAARYLNAQRLPVLTSRISQAAAGPRGWLLRAMAAAAAAPPSVPPTMQAIQVSEVGGPEMLCFVPDAPVPTPGPNTVLVRNHVAGVNFIDTYHRSGLYPVSASPFTVGVEGAGEVVALGAGVEDWKPGDRVAYITRPPAGSYAQYTVVSDTKLARVPAEVDLEMAAASMIQVRRNRVVLPNWKVHCLPHLLRKGMTAMSLVTQAYPVQAGDTVLVTAAAGGTGRLVAQLAAAAGARVIGTTSTAEKAEVARQAGCSEVILYTQQDLVSEVMRLTDGRGVAAVYDGVGRATFDAGLACLQKLGFMVSFGNASGKVPDLDILRLSRHNVRLMRTALWDFVSTKEEFESLSSRTLAAVAGGSLRLLITGRYPLAEAEVSHRDLEARKTTGKLLLQLPS